MSDDPDEQRGFKITDRRGQPKEDRSGEGPDLSASPPKPKPKTRPTGAAQDQPALDFSTFILSMSTSALVHMGSVEDPMTKKKAPNLPLARQEIGIIEMLAEKTKGNLDTKEAKLMEQVLYELRIRFLEASRAETGAGSA